MRWELKSASPPQGGFCFARPALALRMRRRIMLKSEGRGLMANTAILYCWIALGSALGGVARYWCTGFAARTLGETFPWGTLLVNVLGSFIIGFFATLTGPDGRTMVGPDVRTFVMVGFCGGYTTFSSFSIQTLDLIRNRDFLEAGGNILLS